MQLNARNRLSKKKGASEIKYGVLAVGQSPDTTRRTMVEPRQGDQIEGFTLQIQESSQSQSDKNQAEKRNPKPQQPEMPRFPHMIFPTPEFTRITGRIGFGPETNKPGL